MNNRMSIVVGIATIFASVIAAMGLIPPYVRMFHNFSDRQASSSNDQDKDVVELKSKELTEGDSKHINSSQNQKETNNQKYQVKNSTLSEKPKLSRLPKEDPLLLQWSRFSAMRRTRARVVDKENPDSQDTFFPGDQTSDFDSQVYSLMLSIKTMERDIQTQIVLIDVLQVLSQDSDRIEIETEKLQRMVNKQSEMLETRNSILDRYNQKAKAIIDAMGR